MNPSLSKCPSCGGPGSEDSGVCPSCAEANTLDAGGLAEIPGYRVLRLLGKGGMGVVYLAADEVLERRVAVKLISEKLPSDDEVRARFLREARAMAAVEHPHIVQVHHFGEVEGQPYIVMQYVEGDSLARRIRSEGCLEVEEALRILAECVEALDAAGERGIVHRDLKAANILLDAKGDVRVGDFGLARRTALEGDTELTGSGHFVGTPSYVSPEQARGEEVDFRSDIYSLGIVLFEMLTGERPFRGSTVAVIDQHLHEPLPRIRDRRSDVSEALEQLVEWMTRKDRARRPASYEALRAQVDAVWSGEATAPPLIAAEEPERPVFVARDQELARLDGFLDSALDGEGCVAFVTGEAGTGKSALAGELVRRAHEVHENVVVAAGGCSAQTGEGDPYAPFRQVLAQLTGDVEARFAGGALTREQARRLREVAPAVAEAVLQSGRDLVDTLTPGGELLTRAEAAAPAGAPWLEPLRKLVERKAALPPDASLQQAAVFMQVSRVLAAVARVRPLLLVVEDLHWADAGSIALLFHLGRELAGSRILVVGTFRPAEVAMGRGGEKHPLEPVVSELKGVYGDVTVELGQEGDRGFVDALLDSAPNRLGPGFREALYRQTRGHALFTVELLSTMQDRGMLVHDSEGAWEEGPEIDWGGLPARVEGVIGARIERLSEQLQDLLAIASVEGEDFTAELLARVRDEGTRETIHLLSRELERRHRLVSARGVRALGDGRLSLYGFSHVLFQRYLYNSLDEVERAQLHEDVGTVLEALYGDNTEDIAPQLARHFQEAGITHKAILYLQQAGERAARVTANQEAIGFLNRALELLGTLPESPQRDRQELAVQLSCYAPLVATQGWAGDEVGQMADRAFELWQRFGEEPRYLSVLGLLAIYHGSLPEYTRAIELGERWLELAERFGDDSNAIAAHNCLGFCYADAGELARGLFHFEQVVSQYDPERHDSFGLVNGSHPAIASLSHLATRLPRLGFIEQGQQRAREALELARRLDHPHILAFAYLGVTAAGCWRLSSEFLCPEPESAEALLELSETHAFPHFRAWAVILQGADMARRGQADAAVVRISEGIAVCRAIGQGGGLSAWLCVLGSAQLAAGRPEEALETLEEALDFVDSRGERGFVSDILRCKGKAWLATGASDEAEACFRRAVEVAQLQTLKSCELLAATDLARLWHSQGKRRQAHDLLAPVYEWFTEGLDTPPLEEAKALLEDLS